jgi:hypothetical protein
MGTFRNLPSRFGSLIFRFHASSAATRVTVDSRTAAETYIRDF